MSANAKGALLALIAFGLFSTHDVFIKTLGATYSPIQIVFFSVLLSFPLATIMLMRDAKPGTLVPVHPWWMALRTVGAVITGVSAFYAFSNLPLTQTYAILFATPLLITVLSIPILGETVRLPRWVAVIVGLPRRDGCFAPGCNQPYTGPCRGYFGSVFRGVRFNCRAQDWRRRAHSGALAVSNGRQFHRYGYCPVFRLSAYARNTFGDAGRHFGHGVDCRAVHHRCISDRRSGDRGAHAVFTDSVGHGVWPDLF